MQVTISLPQYLMGRDARFTLSDEFRDNAIITVGKMNAVLEEAQADGVTPDVDTITGTYVACGWRPPDVNAETANAAAHSAHITCEACDLRDHRDRQLARWCLKNLDVLKRLGLYLEDPRWCWRAPSGRPWVHLQTRAPRSGHLVFIPSSAPPTAPALIEQGGKA